MADRIPSDRLKEIEELFQGGEAAAAKERLRREFNKCQTIAGALKKSESKLRSIMSQLLNVQEQERRRIAFEMHDELGSSLMALKMDLHRIAKRLPADWGPQRQEFEDCLTSIKNIIRNVRRLSRDLSPTILEDLGLPAALRHLAAELGKHYGINVFFYGEEISGDFSNETRILVYRIVQESLTNIGKHAEAQDVSITLKKHPRCLSFSIADNGKGFDLEEARSRNVAEKGMGLIAIGERVRLLGGILKIESRPGSGTKLLFTVPISF
jgi:signal transduction histidine kinase